MESQAILSTNNPRTSQGLSSSRSAVAKKPARKRSRRGARESIAVVDKHLLTRIREHDFGVWTLEACHAGEISLKLDDEEIAYLPNRLGSSMMAVDACPYIRAAEIATALLSGLALEVSARLRAEFEFALARWIPLYFDL
jgi:hypothetical protein